MRTNFSGVITLTSPLAHGADEKMGVDTKFRRIVHMVDGKTEEIPTVSGNSIRGVMRRLIAYDYIQRLGLEKQGISDKLYYTLFSGGALEKGSVVDHINVGTRREMREMIPFLSVWGGAVGNQIMSGKLIVENAIPICMETMAYTGKESILSYWDCLQEVYMTRRDDLEDNSRQEGEQATQMKYTIECLVPGTRLQHGFVIFDCNAIEAACFRFALHLWMRDACIGGKSAVGLGRFEADYDAGDYQGYMDYVEENKEKMQKYIQQIDGAKTQKKEPKPKSKKGTIDWEEDKGE